MRAPARSHRAGAHGTRWPPRRRRASTYGRPARERRRLCRRDFVACCCPRPRPRPLTCRAWAGRWQTAPRYLDVGAIAVACPTYHESTASRARTAPPPPSPPDRAEPTGRPAGRTDAERSRPTNRLVTPAFQRAHSRRQVVFYAGFVVRCPGTSIASRSNC